MTWRLLAVGDIHLGRRPSRLPEALQDRASELGPSGAWRRTVDAAIRADVDAVLLAGDVVDREDDFFEGYRELHDGVARLARAGIQTLGVAGNHDVHVLPRLAEQIDAFKLVGAGGSWEAVELEEGGEPLTIWGWSFRERQVTRSPLAGERFERRAGLNLGLLHCDRDQSGSPYAPVTSAELAAAGLDGWLLGHIHAPDALKPETPSGYLGSLTGLHPNESGAHGPWLLTVERNRVRDVQQQVLAPLRWERVELDVSGLAEPASARDRLLDRMRTLDAEVSASSDPPEAVGLRVEIVGRSRLGSEVLDLLRREAGEDLWTGAAGSRFFVERLRLATRPELDLEDRARGTDPPGLLARRLLLLERPDSDPERRELIAAARLRLTPVHAESRWQDAEAEPLSDDAIAEWLRGSAALLLERMLARQEDAA